MQRKLHHSDPIPHAMTRRLIRVAALLILLLTGSRGAARADGAPAEAAEQVRSQLVQAQLALVDDPAGAAAPFAAAQAAYTTALSEPLAQAAPEASARAVAGFAAARQALSGADTPAFAAARAQIWTALLGGAYTTVEQAVRSGDPDTARNWLALREFRRTTGTARPGTDATLALAGLRAGTLTPDTALAAVQADLLDAYQGRLAEVLNDLATPPGGGYPAHRAESAALAEGYFLILAPAYGTQQGAAARTTAEQTFAQLRRAGISGQDIPAALTAAQRVLQVFRATPLSPAQQITRAGQLLGFLEQVPLEYTRGVHDGQIVIDLEVQEAGNFQAGATAAFNDLQSLLAARDADKTAQVAAELTTLQQQIAPINRPATAPERVQATVTRIMALLRALMPPEWQRLDTAEFDVVSQMLDQMETAAGSGQYEGAEAARLDAVVALETGIQGRLWLFAPEQIPPLADRLSAGDGVQPGLAALIRAHTSADAIHTARTGLDGPLATARAVLNSPHNPVQMSVGAALAVFRAGWLPIVLLAVLLAGRQRRARRVWALGGGMVAGLLVTIALGQVPPATLADLVRTAALLRAGAGLLISAAWLRLLIGFFRPLPSPGNATAPPPTQQRGWLVGLVETATLALLGLILVSTRSFDTVLALRSLVVAPDQAAALAGGVVGLAGVLLLGGGIWVVLAWLAPGRARLLSAVLLVVGLAVLVGDSIYRLEAMGWAPIHALGEGLSGGVGLWLGLYPRWESIGGQIAALLLVAAVYWRARQPLRSSAPAEMP